MGVLSQKCVIDFDGDVMNDSFYHAWVHNETRFKLKMLLINLPLPKS